MAPKELPSLETLRKLLDYDPETGVLTWKIRSADMFVGGRYPPERQAAAWNSRLAGKPALNSPMSNGYLHGAIGSAHFLAHRVAWKLAAGEDPNEVDHINGDRTDNRFANLSSGDRTANMRNRGIGQNNRSGVIGVYQEASTGKWCAHIEHGNTKRALGRFDDIESAIAARKAAEVEVGFHPNHGARMCHAMAAANFSS